MSLAVSWVFNSLWRRAVMLNFDNFFRNLFDNREISDDEGTRNK